MSVNIWDNSYEEKAQLYKCDLSARYIALNVKFLLSTMFTNILYPKSVATPLSGVFLLEPPNLYPLILKCPDSRPTPISAVIMGNVSNYSNDEPWRSFWVNNILPCVYFTTDILFLRFSVEEDISTNQRRSTWDISPLAYPADSSPTRFPFPLSTKEENICLGEGIP